MINFFESFSPLTQAIIASTLTFLLTTFGASFVFLFKNVNNKVMNYLLGASAGIMLAAAIFSLLLPSIEQANNLNMNTILVVSIGLLSGSILLIVGDKISSKFTGNEENNFRRILLLVTSIVLHNIPEGLAIGVAFGSIIYNIEGATLIAAISLAIGIGLQNIPEGAAISIPLRKEGLSRKKAFLIGTLSGIVEPISAIVGVILVLKIKIVLPILLSFAAGAMLFVIIEELVPECMNDENKNAIGVVTLIGFILMMIMEII